MKLISVNSLDGIPTEHQSDLYAAMKSCSNGQRLAVSLYLMSDLPDARHHLTDVERTVHRMFPPSLKHRYTPQDYVDFQASAIRFCFNLETRNVKSGTISERQRLWVNPRRGHWRNTDLGNQLARQVLRDRGLLVQQGGKVLNPADEDLPAVKRDYMEEELALDALAELASEPEIDVRDGAEVPENLLAHVDRLLSALPEISSEHIPQSSGPSISTCGSPREVSMVVRGMADIVPVNSVRLVLSIDSNGYRVECHASCALDAWSDHGRL